MSRDGNTTRGRGPGVWRRFKRLLRYRLVIPVLRAADHPRALARGVAAGVLIGTSPTLGLQTTLLVLLFLACRPVPWLRFNLVVAFAWSWVSNPFTLGPLYYLYYVTGGIALAGKEAAIQSFGAFRQALAAVTDGMGWSPEAIASVLGDLWRTFGICLAVGSIPYMVIFTLGAYTAAVILLRRHKARRLAEQER